MKTKEKEMEEDMEVSWILRAIPVTLVGLYATGMLYHFFGAFYALGAGTAILVAGLWLSHLYYKLEMRNIKKA